MRNKLIAALLGGVALSALVTGSANAQGILGPLAIEIGWPEILIGAVVYCALSDNCGGKPAQAQAPAPPAGGRTLVIPAEASGACHANLTVNNGRVFRMLLDSGTVGGMALVFGSNMADDLGFNADDLDYSHTYSSANGEGREAIVTLREARFSAPGSASVWVLKNVPAVITKARQDEGLLGAALLHKLNYTASEGYCRLSLPGGETRTATGDVEPVPPSPERSSGQSRGRFEPSAPSPGAAYCWHMLHAGGEVMPGCQRELAGQY